jgi:hypothetical protein
MDKEAAKKLLNETFDAPFDEGRFNLFALNLLNDVDTTKGFPFLSGNYIRHSFKNHITQYRRLGSYTDPQGETIDVLVVKLKNDWALERSRTMLRNFTADYLENRGRKDSALVAYYTDNPEDWRFSYIRMDYKQELTDSGKIRVKKELTPARRYSFLVGVNEPNHTAQAQLLDILKDDRSNPTLSDLEAAFSVDAVTKQFYLDYRDLFIQLHEELDSIVSLDSKVAKEFETKTIDTGNFAKKLMGQIVFLYFLQKKGWLGVGKDENGNFKEWGSGPKNFLQRLFKKEFSHYKNFYCDVLEPLFYEALASEHDDDYYSALDCKIPFLNGGLFEPLHEYNWRETDIRIDNDILADVFTTFNQYNFTVREDEPLEKEVAIDPEMLGKVFENLLPENLRKGKGAYYTPRTIVHYMCQESLINYLDTECKAVPKNDIETLIREGDLILELETAIYEEGKKYQSVLMDTIKENAQALDDALSHIKVCDPAIGSGAFPVGMLNEIVKARKVLELYLEKEETTYTLKRHCIQESIYGVDIDPGAIDIAKLRLWLSLVVDENDYKHIQTLPNLDYKIMQGNSLIEEFHGISLDIEKKDEQFDVFSGGSSLDVLIENLHKKQADFFNAVHPNDKKKKREAVETAIFNIFHNESEKKRNISPQETQVIESDLKEMTHGNKIRNFFPWKLYFADVFRENGGFDVVIANPPYVNTKDVAKYEWRSNLKNEFGWVDDLYNHFTFLALKFSKNNGIVTFITSDTFFTIQTKANMRQLLLVNEIIHLIPTPKAFSAMVDTAIFIVKKTENTNNYKIKFSDIRKPDFDQLGFSNQLIKSSGSEIATWERILDPLFANLKSGKFYTKSIEVDLFRENLSQVFFSPTEMNLQIIDIIIPSVKKLYNEYWELIKTSREISKNSVKLNEYRGSLKSGDLTMLGLVTEGGQGMATGNNGRFVGCLKGTKSANRILETRSKKLAEAFVKEKSLFDLYPLFSNCASKNDFDYILKRMEEVEIRAIFDDIKLKTDRDIFGQGYLFRIIDPSEIANIDAMPDNEKQNGIDNRRNDYFVLYDKGDKDGNRWFAESPYLIDWSTDAVSVLQTDRKARWQGYNFFFRAGFCWSDIHTTYLKSRIKLKSVHDVKSMSLFNLSDKISTKYIICIINSSFASEFQQEFYNNTSSFQINDARKIPIIIPTTTGLLEFNDVFDRACALKEQEFSEELTKDVTMQKLNAIQIELDEMVYSLYGLTDEEIAIVEESVG